MDYPRTHEVIDVGCVDTKHDRSAPACVRHRKGCSERLAGEHAIVILVQRTSLQITGPVRNKYPSKNGGYYARCIFSAHRERVAAGELRSREGRTGGLKI